MDSLMAASREFFRKPLEEKQAYSNLIILKGSSGS
jgi:isopenicillin N synthase-like dioxygenase